MAGFPDLPRIRGDTDDDASIHLYSHVGPARPISRRKYDNEIMDILSREPPQTNQNIGNLNAQFEEYAGKNRYWSDSDAETQVEDEPQFKQQPKRKARKAQQAPPPTSYFDSPKLAFAAVFLLMSVYLFVLWPLKPASLPKIVPSSDSVNSRIDLVEQRISALGEISSALDQQVDMISSKQGVLIGALDDLSSSVNSLKQNFSTGKSQYDSIYQEIHEYRKRLEAVELVAEDPEQLEIKLAQISQKLSQLSAINLDLASIKSDIVQEFLSRLPEHVPVYIKDKKVHYLPEFSKYIYSLVDKYNAEGHMNLKWESFIKENGNNFQEYMGQLLRNSKVQFITRNELEKSLQDKFATYNEEIVAKFNSLIDKIDLSANLTHVDVTRSGSRVVLDNLLDFISQGSLKVNYADYNLGSRILGFLTTTGKDAFRNRSLARKVFLGWYDYLTSSGLRAPKYLKFNANNVLIDGGQYWQCESSWCSVGVRLSTPIILTDLILNNPTAERPSDVNVPSALSIYIKPRKRSHAHTLEEYLRYQTFMSPPSNNKYLSKFHKIQEVKLRGGPVEHVKLPVSIVNMKIPVRDIYLEIRTTEGNTGLYNLKAYGLTEFNSMKYAEHFDSVLDDLVQGQDTYQYRHYDSSILGDDDYI